MRSPRLSVVLILVSAAVLILAIGAVSWSAARVLARIAEEQAVATARVAAAEVVESLQRAQETLAVSAELLAERPTLRQLAVARDEPALGRFLQAFCDTSGLDTCAVIAEGELVGFSDEPPPLALVTQAARRVRVALAVDADGRRVQIVSYAAVEAVTGVTVLVTDRIDPAFASDPGSAERLRLWSRATLEEQTFGARSPLRETALRLGESSSARIATEGAFVAVAPLRSAGAVVGLVEVDVPIARAVAARRAWVREVRRIALIVLLAALVGSVVLGRRLARPVETMTHAAERIGLGDLETPVPPGPGGELGALSRALDEMRLRLLEQSRQLAARQAETEAMLGGIVDGVFAVDGERRIRLLNPQGAKLLGIPPEQALGRFCGDVLRPVGSDGVRPCEEHCPILEARAGGRARAVEQVVTATGETHAVVITSAPPVGGRQVQLMRTEMQDETTRRLRDTVVANISHEFRTPLAAQLASIEMLRERLGEPPQAELRGLIETMGRGVVRLTRLTDNLLESVRLDAGERSIRRAPLALDEVVEESVESMRSLLEQRRQMVQVDLPHPLPAILGDGPRLVQVIVNLLANANKFAPEATTIRVGGAVEPGWVTLWVEDEGPGLPAGDDETVFARFVRRAGEEPEQSGMGLGLWIARSIVERHGGRIYAASIERGAKLCIVLPEAPVEDPRRR